MTVPIKIISKNNYLKNHKKPIQKTIWNKIAKPWKTYVVKRIPKIEKFLKRKKGKIIDLGCGTGRNLIPSKNIEYLAVDFSEGQLAHAKKYIKENKINAKTLQASADNLSKIKSETFDYGLFIAALHCIETKEKRKKALKEFHRILKPKAKAIITTWNSDDKRFDKIKKKGDIYMAWNDNHVPHMRYYYLYKKEELKELIEEAGFKIIDFSIYNEKATENIDRFSKKNWILEVQKI